MMKLTPDDLAQISLDSLEKMKKSDLINLTLRLRAQLCEAVERLNQDSKNSSKPPSSDNPYKKEAGEDENDAGEIPEDQKESDESEIEDQSKETPEDKSTKRKPGKQPGSEGHWRTEKPVAERIEHHHPQQCVLCNKKLEEKPLLYSGHYTYELEIENKCARIICTLHYYYESTCSCGHRNISCPGEGYISTVEGRKRNIKLSENSLVGPMLATFIAALNRRYGMSRKKIRDFLLSWYKFELGIGTICKCIREAGIACYPVVDQLVEELQEQEKVNLDETPWYQKGKMLWLWVAVSAKVIVYYIGTRKKEELLNLITDSFFGWLITDGYFAYRSHEKRQRCLAHLIRKAIALTGVIDKNVNRIGDWFLRELRGLIKAMADGENGPKKCRPILARLKRACNLGANFDHPKLKALAKEILNDWDAVVAFVKNPGLPATNNDAERALRQSVIFRRITFGTRTDEGSRSYAAFISVVETCRARNIDPWSYIAEAIAAGRKGNYPPSISSI
ncbi:MAG: IS66 family transposase [Chitinivibrionales bacterium]|nr:IS66 family transposase [Chitinivibrionales bacterium]